MMFLENKYLVAPWTIKVRYSDPAFKVLLVDVYFHPIETVVPMWMCADSIIEAGKAPLFGAHGKEVQDMAFLSDNQEHYFLTALFEEPVKDENGDLYYPELSFHLQYLLDVLFGIRGYETADGLAYVATDLDLADKWRKAICSEGKAKMKASVKSERYLNFAFQLDRLVEERKNLTLTPEVKKEQSILITQLASKL
jgi:hypothetical protein